MSDKIIEWVKAHPYKAGGILALVIFILLGITFGTVPTFPE